MNARPVVEMGSTQRRLRASVVFVVEGVIPFSQYELLSDLAGEAARKIIDHWDGWEAEAGRQAQQHQAPVEAIVMQARIGVVVENALIELWTRKGGR